MAVRRLRLTPSHACRAAPVCLIIPHRSTETRRSRRAVFFQEPDYEHLTSDAVIDEVVAANDYALTASSRRFG